LLVNAEELNGDEDFGDSGELLDHKFGCLTWIEHLLWYIVRMTRWKSFTREFVVIDEDVEVFFFFVAYGQRHIRRNKL